MLAIGVTSLVAGYYLSELFSRFVASYIDKYVKHCMLHNICASAFVTQYDSIAL